MKRYKLIRTITDAIKLAMYITLAFIITIIGFVVLGLVYAL